MPSTRSAGQLSRYDKRAARLEIVPVDPLREEFLRLEHQDRITAYGVALKMCEAGHMTFSRKPSPAQMKRGLVARPLFGGRMADSTRLKRALGIKLTPQSKVKKSDGTLYPPKLARYISYEYAVTLADILGMAPTDAGV